MVAFGWLMKASWNKCMWTLPRNTNTVHVRGVRVSISSCWVQQHSGPVWCASSSVHTSVVCFISSSHHSSARWTISLLFGPWERDFQEANPSRHCEPKPFRPQHHTQNIHCCSGSGQEYQKMRTIVDWIFSIPFQLQAQPSMELLGAPATFSPAGALCWHCLRSSVYPTWRTPSYSEFKDPWKAFKESPRMLMLDPIWCGWVDAAWDTIGCLYEGDAVCAIAGCVNTFILLSFWLDTRPCEALHIVLF